MPRVNIGSLVELIKSICQPPSDNPQSRSMETHDCQQMARDVAILLPKVAYTVFSELAGKLDQNGETYEAYLARQIATLYFLLRLSPLYNSPGKMVALIDDETFPSDVLSDGPITAGNALFVNYLTESWNRYTQYGGLRTEREAIAETRLYYLVREVVRVYGWWTWPFFNHYNSSDHVDQITKLVEESNGRIPIPNGSDRSDMRSDVFGKDLRDDEEGG